MRLEMKKTLALAEDHWSYFIALATIEEEKLIAQTILTPEGSLLAYLLKSGKNSYSSIRPGDRR